MFTKKTPFLIAASLVSALSLSADDLASVKGIYMDRQHPATLGLAFYIDLIRDGKKVRVPSSFEFHSGDRFYVNLEVRNPSFIYVINRTLNGGDKALDMIRQDDSSRTPPASELPHLVFGPEKVEPAKFRQIPRSTAMVFDNVTGVEKLFVVVSPVRIPDLERDFGPQGAVSSDTNSSALQNLDKSLSGWAKHSKQAVPVAGKGIYLDNPDGYAVQPNPGEPLVGEITLAHVR